jgi:hypothetical protein
MSAKTESKPARTSIPDTISKPLRVGRIRGLPVSKSLAERLIREGIVKSYTPVAPGSKRGPRLIDLDSFEAWILTGKREEALELSPPFSKRPLRPRKAKP